MQTEEEDLEPEQCVTKVKRREFNHARRGRMEIIEVSNNFDGLDLLGALVKTRLKQDGNVIKCQGTTLPAVLLVMKTLAHSIGDSYMKETHDIL